MEENILISPLLPEHWQEVSKIYQEGMDTKMATFEIQIPTWENWNKNHLKHSRLIAKINGEIIAWAVLSAVSSRDVYSGVAEVTIYVAKKVWGKKVGEKLILALIKESEENGIWTLQSVIFSENKASIALHQKVGFRKVGYKEKIAQLNGVWKDNLILERRSKKVGV